MRERGYLLTYIVVLVVQIIIFNYLDLSHYVLLSLMPAAVMMLPMSCGVLPAMALAFASGLALDFLCDGVPGLNALALTPVAYFRFNIIRAVFGSEVFARKETISLRKHGAAKMALALLLAQGLFVIIYVWADGAGTRPFWFNLVKCLLSTLAGLLASLGASSVMTPEERD